MYFGQGENINGGGNFDAGTVSGQVLTPIISLGNSGSDTLVENDATVGNTDVLQFASDVRADQIWFRHVGNDLEVDIIGMLIKDWYAGSQTLLSNLYQGMGRY